MYRGHSSYSQDSAIETENDRLTDELKGKITSLKSLSIDIGSELKGQNKFLGEMDDEFDGAGGFLGKAVSQVAKLAKVKLHKNMYLYLILFSAFVFFILWLIIKF